jgi:ribosomal protein S18 acetylase RimI-like enzyme
MVSFPLTAHIVLRRAFAGDLPALEWDGELKHFRRIFSDAYRLMQSGDVLIWIVELPGVGLIGQLFIHLYHSAGRGIGGLAPENPGLGDVRAGHEHGSIRSFESPSEANPFRPDGDRWVSGPSLPSRVEASAQSKPYAYIYGFRIQPAYRSRGIGSHVLETIESDLVRRGFHRITLNVARENLAARRLYERQGYRIVAPEPGVWSYLDEEGQRQHVNEPAWRMEKEI